MYDHNSVTPSLMREASYSSLRMGLYDVMKGIVAPNAKTKDDFTLVCRSFHPSIHLNFYSLVLGCMYSGKN
jgi:hypothetical protein